MKTFKLRTPNGERTIGAKNSCFIVAEVSANHQQKFDNAVKIIKSAAAAGADAIKLQTYTPDTITIDSRKEWFIVGREDSPETWKSKSLYELYQKAYTPWEWHEDLKKIAEDLGMVLFSTPFDETAVDFLQERNVPCYKIAAYEATDLILLKKVAQTGKPIIMSIGFATLDEIELSVKTLREKGAKDIALLHCTTSYSDTPKPEHTNLRTMHDLQTRFDVVTGLSDNIGGIEVPILAHAMGASIIEKHVVVEHDEKILDDRFSLDHNELKSMVEKIRWQERIMGNALYGTQTPQEEYYKKFRRSLFVVKDMKKGEQFTKKNIRSIRPAVGLETKYYEDVIGKTAKNDIERGTPLSWDLMNK